MIHQKSFLYADLELKKHFLLLSMLKTVVLLNIGYCGNSDLFFSYKVQKNSIYLK